MRKFNRREKEILSKICDIKMGELNMFSHFLQENIFTKSNGIALFIRPGEQDAILYISSDLSEKERKRKLDEFLELLALISYLNEERYVFMFQGENNQKNTLLVMHKEFDKISNSPPKFLLNEKGAHIKPKDASNIFDANDMEIFKGIIFKNNETPIYQIIVKNTLGILFPTEDLKEYVSNGYKDSSQIKHEQTMLISRLAILVAILISLIGVLCN
jgi:hypothetical protein